MPEPKKLYIAQSVDELSEKASNLPKTAKIQRLLQSAPNILREAKVNQTLGDEEKAYLLFMRFLQIVQNAIKEEKQLLNQYNISGIQYKEALTKAEELNKSLCKRYATLNDVPNGDLADHNEDSKESLKYSISNSITNIIQPKKITKSIQPSTLSNSISAMKLFELMQDKTVSLVVFDVRSTKSYMESHMKHKACISIPEDIIRPGTTSMAIEKLVPPSGLPLWRKRSQVDYVILLDWSSSASNVIENSPLDALQKAIFKWDQINILKSHPLILERGYDEWLLAYPCETTNSNVYNDTRRLGSPSSNSKELIQLDSVDYPDLNEAFMDESTSIQNDENSLVEETSEIETPLKPDAFFSNLKPQIDRTKKPTKLYNPPSGNLSPFKDISNNIKMAWADEDEDEMVANLLKNQEKIAEDAVNNAQARLEKEREFERLCLLKENQANLEMKEEIQKQEEKLNEKIKQLEVEKHRLEKESDNLRIENTALKKEIGNNVLKSDHNLIEKHLKKKNSDKMQLDAEIKKLREERKLKERERLNVELERLVVNDVPKTEIEPQIPTISKIILPKIIMETMITPTISNEYTERLKLEPTEPVKRGLSRSHSSPNINELFAEDDQNLFNLIPNIDRNVKPRRPNVDRMLKPAETSAARQRDLAPVYSSHGKAQTGLRNLGNTCFMNSVIQCLYSTLPLTDYLISNEYNHDINKSNKEGTQGKIIEELSVVMSSLCNGKLRSIAPVDFKNTVSRYLPICVGYEQQDAHEFLTYLMEKLHADVNKAATNVVKMKPPDLEKVHSTQATVLFWEWHTQYNNSMFVELFEGVLQSKLTCLSCHAESNNYEVFSCLSVPIPSQSKSNLKDCIQSFLKAENICGEAAWDCPNCKQKREAEKRMVICKLPKILIIHLKRFFFKGMWRQKLQTHVDFPLNELDMKPYSIDKDNKSKYFAYGVVNHYGTMEGGHYTAYCKKTINDQWFKCDDADVSEMKASSVKTSAAYILFYSSINF